MPLVKKLPDAEKHLNKGRVMQAIETMARHRLCHKDLKWRHVGVVGGKVVFFDLARVEAMDELKAKEEMLRQLREDLLASVDALYT
jgi:aminoglycoside phosphotransferase family enzyme